MKKFLLSLSGILIIIAIFTVWFLNHGNDVYNRHKKYRQTFGIIQFETLNHSLSDSDKEKAEPIFDLVKSAISYSGSKKDCKFEEPLVSLCRFTDDYNYTRNESDVSLVTYKQINKVGYLWIKYTRECFDANGENVNGAWDILCLIKVKNNDGNFVIEDVIETP